MNTKHIVCPVGSGNIRVDLAAIIHTSRWVRSNIYMYKEVQVIMELKPTDGHKSFYDKALVCRYGCTYFLYSYGKMVAGIEGGVLHRHWDGYSVTTMRHINSFCETYGASKINKKKWLEMPVEVCPRLERIGNDH